MVFLTFLRIIKYTITVCVCIAYPCSLLSQKRIAVDGKVMDCRSCSSTVNCYLNAEALGAININ